MRHGRCSKAPIEAGTVGRRHDCKEAVRLCLSQLTLDGTKVPQRLVNVEPEDGSRPWLRAGQAIRTSWFISLLRRSASSALNLR